MQLVELNIEEFSNFAKNHPLTNYHQTINYALLMSENGYDYDLIGYKDDENNIIAASLILLKSIGFKCFYGYAPRGFLIDYQNEYILKRFTEEIKKYYYKKNVVFIKVNPFLTISNIDNKTFAPLYNDNKYVKETLSILAYKKLKDNLYFEAMLPRFEAYINLKEFAEKKLNKNTRNKIKKGIRKGLTLEKCNKDKLNIFHNFIKNKLNRSEYYFQDYYTAFAKDNSIDLFLVSIDYYTFLQNSQYMYNKEQEKNTKYNEKLINNNSNKVINAKMQSDKVLLTFKNDIMEATKYLNSKEKYYIAGALVIKHNNVASVIMSGFDQNYKRFAPNYFLYYNLIKYYKNNFEYLNIGGVVGDFKNDSPYSGLNRFKLGFNPEIHEYIGEFDLVIEPKSYGILLENGILAREFAKEEDKNKSKKN